jgi:hypothetical protein
MKGTVMRPPGPATAATASASQKQTPGNTSTGKDGIVGEERPVSPSANLITLAVLEEHSAQRARGYDPYNAGVSPAAVEAWKQKRKRD